MIPDSFTAGQAARLSHTAYRTLDYWAKSGFVAPSVAPSRGKGSQRRYSFGDLVALRVATLLRGQGISLQQLRKVVARLRARGYETPLSQVYLVSDGLDVFERQGDELLSLLHRPGQGAFLWVLNLGEVERELRRELAA